MLSRILAVALLVCAFDSSSANPLIATHPVYMSAERLDVKLLRDSAEMDGRFHFRSTATQGDPGVKANVVLSVPIWVPRDLSEADSATASLLLAAKVSSNNELKDNLQAAWASAIGLRIYVGEQPLKITDFSLFDPRSKLDQKRLPPEWFHQDYYCILVKAEFQPELLAADPEIRVLYRQGLRRTSAGPEFHYLPMFRNMPKDHTTRELQRYCMYLVNDSGLAAKLGAATVRDGYSLILPLAHYEPIGITLKSKE